MATNMVFKRVGPDRTFAQQGGYQIAALAISLGIALLGGAFSGFVASRVGRKVQHLFDDEEHWHGCAYDIPLEEEEEENHVAQPGSYFNKVEKDTYRKESEAHLHSEGNG